MAQWLKESVAKAAEEARQEELRRKIEDEVTQKLSDKFTKHLADAKTSLEKKLKKQIKKSQTKVDRIWDFFTRQERDLPRRCLLIQVNLKRRLIKMRTMRTMRHLI